MKKSFLLFLFFINVSITYAQEHIDLISFSASALCDSVDVELDKARAVIFDKSRDKNNFKIVIRVKTNCLFENLIGAYQLRGDTLNLLFTLKGAPIRGENVVYQSRINPENDGELEMALCDCYSELTYKFSNIDSEPILTLFSKQLYPPNQIYPISEPTFEIYKKDTINYTDSIGSRQGRWLKMNKENQIVYEEYYLNNHSDSSKIITYFPTGQIQKEIIISKNTHELTYNEVGFLEYQCKTQTQFIDLLSSKYKKHKAQQWIDIEVCFKYNKQGEIIETTVHQKD